MIKSKKKTNSILYRSLFVLFVLCSMTLYAQDQKQQERKTRVDLLHADIVTYQKNKKKVVLLAGNEISAKKLCNILKENQIN